MALEFSVRL